MICYYFRYYALWKNGIAHCDISAWNLMWDPKDECVLNDFDLSVIKYSERCGGERTGTLLFMAGVTLTNRFREGNQERQYWYEVESFVWVFA
ncbi:hypothetical protein BDQ17DRAFT_1231139 [Cyathus striatus]|nr:hypothetical protein BDQ17DRAFT_1231139 [Cyathus striatus]